MQPYESYILCARQTRVFIPNYYWLLAKKRIIILPDLTGIMGMGERVTFMNADRKVVGCKLRI